MSQPMSPHDAGMAAAKGSGKSHGERFRAGEIDLSELNRLAAAEGDAATSAEAVNPPGTGKGMKSVTTSDTP